MADVFVRNRRAQTRCRGRELGEIPLSAGEIEYLTRVDESARRRQRLLQVREQEKRAAQLVTQRYRENLKKLQGYRMKYAQQDHRQKQDVLLSALHEKYQFSLQGMGMAQRNAREKVMELVELAQVEQRKWADNRRGEKERFEDAVDAVREDATARLARRREVERNLLRLKEMSVRQRSEASARAKRELELQLQLQRAQEEAQRYRLLHAESEEISYPRKTQRDVMAYQFTRTHCVALPVQSGGENKNASTGATDGFKEVKIIRHNRVQRHQPSALDQAEIYRQEMDRKREEDWCLQEENTRVAVTRGQEASEFVEAVRGGQRALDWLTAIDREERVDATRQAESGPSGIGIQVRARTSPDPDTDGSAVFARMFGIEDTGDLMSISVTDEDDHVAHQRVTARHLDSIDDSDLSSPIDEDMQFVSGNDHAVLRNPNYQPRSEAERAIEHKLQTMNNLLKTVASYGHGKTKAAGESHGLEADNDVSSRQVGYEERRRAEAEKVESPARSVASHSSRDEQVAILPTATDSATARRLLKTEGDQDISAPLPAHAQDISAVLPAHAPVESHRIPGDLHEGATTSSNHPWRADDTYNAPARGNSIRKGFRSVDSFMQVPEIEKGQGAAESAFDSASDGERSLVDTRRRGEGSPARDNMTQEDRRLSLEQLEMELKERTQQLESQFGRDFGGHRRGRKHDRGAFDGLLGQNTRAVDVGDHGQQSRVSENLSEDSPKWGSGAHGIEASSEMMQTAQVLPSVQNNQDRIGVESRARDASVSSGISVSEPPLKGAPVNRHTRIGSPDVRTSSDRFSSSSESSTAQGRGASDSEALEEGNDDGGAKSVAASPQSDVSMGRARAVDRESFDTEVGSKARPSSDTEMRPSWVRDRHSLLSQESGGSDANRERETKHLIPGELRTPDGHEHYGDTSRPRDSMHRPTLSYPHDAPRNSTTIRSRAKVGQDAHHRSTPIRSTAKEGRDDNLDGHSEDEAALVLSSSGNHDPRFQTGSESGENDVRLSSAVHDFGYLVVDPPEPDVVDDDDDESSFLSDYAIEVEGSPYLRQMGHKNSMAGSSSSALQYSLPLSDSFSSMSASHLDLDTVESLTNQLVPIFPHQRPATHEDADAGAHGRFNSLSAQATGETAILLDGLSSQEIQAELLRRQTTQTGRASEDGGVEVQSALNEPRGIAMGNTAHHVDVGVHESNYEDVRDHSDSRESSILDTRENQDKSFSSDVSSDTSAYMYLERMQQMAGLSNIASHEARRAKNLSVSNLQDRPSRVLAAVQREPDARSSMAPAHRRDSAGSSSSSAPSVDARFEYLVHMTAVAGKALPLHLNLPSDHTGLTSMRQPPPRVDLSTYSSDSESNISTGDTLARRHQVAGEGDSNSVNVQHRSTSKGPGAGAHQQLPSTASNPVGAVDFSIPPPPIFGSSSSASSDIDVSRAAEISKVSDLLSANRPVQQFDLDDLGHRIASLPPRPFGDFNMSQPPPPLMWLHSDDDSDEDDNAAVGNTDALATKPGSLGGSAVNEDTSDTTPQKKGGALFVPFEAGQQHTAQAPMSPESVSLADAFRAHHPSFHRRAQSTATLLEQRREQLAQRRVAESQDSGLAQSRGSSDQGQSASASRLKPPSRSASTKPQSPSLNMPNPELLDRLAAGERAKISAEEMRERTRRLYNQLPEVTERKRQEDVLSRRRQRLAELREREKTRRQQQRERQQRAS